MTSLYSPVFSVVYITYDVMTDSPDFQITLQNKSLTTVTQYIVIRLHTVTLLQSKFAQNQDVMVKIQSGYSDNHLP